MASNGIPWQADDFPAIVSTIIPSNKTALMTHRDRKVRDNESICSSAESHDFTEDRRRQNIGRHDETGVATDAKWVRVSIR